MSMRQSPITLKDVARLARVSPITVSRALTKPELVSPAARAKVALAVEQTGYVSNSLARGLTSARTRLIAAIVPSIAQTLFSEMMQSLINEGAQHGYHTMLGLSGYSAVQEESLIATLLSQRPDGVALTGIDHTARTKKLILTAGIPVVELWDYTPNPIDMVAGVSHEEAGRAAFRHLIGQGYKKPAILRADDLRAGRRAAGFSSAAQEMGYPPPIEHVFSEQLPQPGRGQKGLQQLLAGNAGIDAVFCSSDSLAQGVLAQAHELKLHVPRQLGVLGFGDQVLADQTIPPLSSIQVDGARMGRVAMRGLLSRIESWPQPELLSVDLGFQLIKRGST
jgi:LacI family gluconate utilization system Gnt-I transcriptional repressor